MSPEESQPTEVVRRTYPEQVIARKRPPSLPIEEQRITHLREYLNVILARRLSFLAAFVLIMAAGTISLYRQMPVYRATLSLQIDREDARPLSFDSVAPSMANQDDALQTQFKILSSESLAQSVIQDLGLDKDVAKNDRPAAITGTVLGSARQFFATLLNTLLSPKTAAPPVPVDKDPLRAHVSAYLSSLVVTPVLRTRLVNISIEHGDPTLAARIANAHAEHFIEQNLQARWNATQVASEFLGRELATMRANLENVEQRLQRYSEEHQIFVFDEGNKTETRNTETERLANLHASYTKAQTERIQAESFARLAKEQTQSPVESGAWAAGSLGAQLIELQRQDAALAARFRPDFGPRKEVQNQIQTISAALETEKASRVKQAQEAYALALDREETFARELEKQGEKVNRMKQETLQYEILKREADSNRLLYDTLLLRLKEAGISSSLKASNIRIVDRARVPNVPVRPNKRRGLINSAVLALAAALGFVLFQEYMDSSLKSPDDVVRQTKLPTLGLIPRLHKRQLQEQGQSGYLNQYLSRRKPGHDPQVSTPVLELISHSAPASLLAEAYRSLRASLILSSPNHPPRTILVTSAVPSEGKTATATNLAISLTQTGAKVLLIDADMRRPRIDALLSMENKAGLSNFLTGTARLQDAIHESQVPALSVMPCGAMPPNPGELILSPRFTNMLDRLQEEYQFIVIDSPPLSNVSEGRIIAAAVDGVVFVIRALSTSRHAVSRSLEQLGGARVVGVVLNGYDLQDKGNYYYPYYAQHRSERSKKSTDGGETT